MSVDGPKKTTPCKTPPIPALPKSASATKLSLIKMLPKELEKCRTLCFRILLHKRIWQTGSLSQSSGGDHQNARQAPLPQSILRGERYLRRSEHCYLGSTTTRAKPPKTVQDVVRRAACKCRQARAPRPGPWAALLMADGPLPQLQKIPQCAAKRCLEPARPWGGAQHGIIWGWVCLPSRIHHEGVYAPPEKAL